MTIYHVTTGENNLGDFWFFFPNMLLYVRGVLGFSIIPKWLIKIPGHIPILFGWFRELRKFCQNLNPETSGLSPKCFKKYKKNYGIILENIVFVNLGHQKLRKIGICMSKVPDCFYFVSPFFCLIMFHFFFFCDFLVFFFEYIYISSK